MACLLASWALVVAARQLLHSKSSLLAAYRRFANGIFNEVTSGNNTSAPESLSVETEASNVLKESPQKGCSVPAEVRDQRTPLIDVLLVCSSFSWSFHRRRRRIKTQIPVPAPTGSRAKTGKGGSVLSLRGIGTIRINQGFLELSGVMPRLQEIFRTRGDRTIFVQADSDLLFNDVATLIDIAKGAGSRARRAF